jgi:hypothetical protein
MKITIITFIILIKLLGSLEADPGTRFTFELFESDNNLLQRVTNMVRKLKNVTVSSSTPLSTNIVNLWDVIPSEYRILLLNQTQIQQLDYSYSQNLPNGIRWASLPSNVKDVLVSLFNNLSFLNLKFLDWSWVDSKTDAYADSTLYSLFPADKQALLPSIQILTNQLSLDQVVNTTDLREKNDHSKRPINSIVTKIINSSKKHKRDLSSSEKFNLKPASLSSIVQIQNSPWSVVNQALKRAKTILKSYNL